MENHRNQVVELSDILHRYGGAYQKRFTLCPSQKKAFEAIVGCRSVAMGSHVDKCNSCGYRRISYNSCRNRHCPKCQYIKQEIWVDKLQHKLLPTRYFHIVFTVPDFFKRLFYINQQQCYNLLFQASARAIQKAAANPAFLGVQSGCLSILHTWGQSLNYHPHIHALVPAGGLDEDGLEWVKSHQKFFVPVKALSRIYRGVFMRLLEKMLDEGKLTIPEKDHGLYGDKKALKEISYEELWHVHIKKTFKGAGQVVSYLGRYTHRVAISNNKILSDQGENIRFKWKDYRDGHWKIMDLEPLCFIRRFMQHILTTGFYKIRYFGIFASASSKTKMDQCFALLHASPGMPVYQGLPLYEVLSMITGKDLSVCPSCKKGRMITGGREAILEKEPT
jgi:hypothetical protein